MAETDRIREIDRIFSLQKGAYSKNMYPTIEERLQHLDNLYNAIRENRERIATAINADFGCRSFTESYVADVFAPMDCIRYAKKNLKKWMKPSKRDVAIWYLPAENMVIPQPVGLVGVISPWNFPLYLSLGPAISALAAGNRVMIKFSEHTPRTGELLAEIIRGSFAEDHFAVVNGGAETGEAFTKKKFDHIIFTGSTAIGRKVLQEASVNLTPVTLELGGKSPAIISPGFPMKTAAERIMFWKCINAGQVCATTDYVMVREGEEESFIKSANQAVSSYYPKLESNENYTAVIDERHYKRLVALLDDARRKGARIVEINPAGEKFFPSKRKIPPTLLLKVTDDMKIMQEEIFGPLLPVITYGNMEEAKRFVNSRPRPLALYYFDHDQTRIDLMLRETISGSVAINDTVWQYSQDGMPIGGIGESGMGHYHGREGFETFSKMKPVFRQKRFNALGLMRPPYGAIMKNLLKLMLR
ncbi:MAG: coniferyl aldehyde dehydrogenase [Nitrospinota bacterium]|nr:coniferyl aldehyde dehydrogenase [Nitrospinota bacterium]